MIKLNITPGTYAAGATIPLTTEFNTNNWFGLTNNAISIRKAGFAEVEGTITLVATAIGDVQIQLVDESGNVLTSATTSLAAVGNYDTLPIYDLVRTIYNTANTYDSIHLVTNAAVTVNNGTISAKYVR